MQPFVVRRGELVDVQLIVSDRNGLPLDDEVSVELLGEYGPIPMTGRYVETSRSGAFPQKLVRGIRRDRISWGMTTWNLGEMVTVSTSTAD